jgi:hypothetical protein
LKANSETDGEVIRGVDLRRLTEQEEIKQRLFIDRKDTNLNIILQVKFYRQKIFYGSNSSLSFNLS